MPSALDLRILAADVARLASDAVDESLFEHVDGTLRVYHWARQHRTGDTYCLRYDYGESLAAGPPSVVFCNVVSKAEGDFADWPTGPESFFKRPPANGPTGWVCTPATREGVQHHAEWRDLAPVHPIRPLAGVVASLLEILNGRDVPQRTQMRAAS